MIYKSYNQNVIRPLTYLTLAVLAAVAGLLIYSIFKFNFKVKAEPRKEQVQVSPMQIKSVKDTRIWEFLTVTDEELVTTSKKSLLSGTSHLTRIYYGKVRFGIDLDKAEEDWVTMRGDTVDVKLPRIQLLDRRFIDEARTETFFESGSWSNAEREQLYVEATRQMTKRCVTSENVEQARESAVAQFEKIFQAMGFMYVDVHF